MDGGGMVYGVLFTQLLSSATRCVAGLTFSSLPLLFVCPPDTQPFFFLLSFYFVQTDHYGFSSRTLSLPIFFLLLQREIMMYVLFRFLGGDGDV